jgi:hypothetical protein
MVPRFNRSLLLLIILSAGMGLLAPAARANMEVTFQEDSGLVRMIPGSPGADFGSLGFNGYYSDALGFTSTPTDFKVVFFGTTANPGSLGGSSNLMTSTTEVTNTTGSPHTLNINVTEQDYTFPGTSGSTLSMTSHIGGTVTTGGPSQTLTFQSFADNLNRDFGTDATTTSTGKQTPDVTGSMASSYKNDATPATFSRTSTLYSVTVTNALALVAGGDLNYGSTTTLAATPAPAGLVLALTGLPALGIGGWLRRRHKKAPC